MTVKVDVLQTFLAVIDCGSVIEASRVRGFSAAAVSRQIGELQRRLGVQLFVPDGRSIRPTPAALQFAEPARHLIREVIRFERFAQRFERAALGERVLLAGDEQDLTGPDPAVRSTATERRPVASTSAY